MSNNLSSRSLQRLAKFIATIAEGEKKTELVRQVLAEQTMFEPYTAFKRLDQARVGHLLSSDLAEYMHDNSIVLSEAELRYLMSRFDCNRDGFITYPDFVKSILPQADKRLRQLASLRDGYYIEVNMLLPYEVEWALARVFEQEIKNFVEIQISLEILNSSPDFNALDGFQSIDKRNIGSITPERLQKIYNNDSLNEFTRQNGQYLSSDEIQAFFRVVDTDDDGKISYTEFLESLQIGQYSTSLPEPDRQPEERVPLVDQEIQKSRIILENLEKSLEVEREISRSRERDLMLQREQNKILDDAINKSRELSRELEMSRQKQSRIQADDYNLRNQKRLALLEEIRIAREKQSRMEQIERKREIEESVYRQQQRLEALKKSQIYDEQLQRSREKIVQLQMFKREQEELRLSREKESQLEALRKSKQRLQELEGELEQQRAQQQSLQKTAQKLQQSNVSQNQDYEPKLATSKIYQTPVKKVTSPKQFTNGSRYNTTPLRTTATKDSARGSDEYRFVSALKEQIELNREVEDIKSQLAFKSDFHPQAAFDLLDINSRGHLTKLDFELVINDLGIYPTSEQIRLFFQHFCPDTSFLTFKQFLQIVVPISEQYEELMLSRNPSSKMSLATQSLFKTLLKKYFYVEEHFETVRQKLCQRNTFNITQAFHFLDQDDKGFVTIDEFTDLFRRNQIFTTRRDIEGLLNIYDKNKDGRVTYIEFLGEISPKKALRF